MRACGLTRAEIGQPGGFVGHLSPRGTAISRMVCAITKESLSRTSIVRSGIVLTISLAIASGCGDDGDASGEGGGYQVQASTTMTVASPPLTKAQFVAQMNKTCRKAWATVVDNFAVYSGTQDPEEMSRRRRLAESIQLSLLAGVDFHIFDNFRILGGPRGEERAIEEIIGPFQLAVELGQLRLRLFTFPQVAEHFADYNRRAARYGLDDCLVDLPHLRRLKLVTSS